MIMSFSDIKHSLRKYDFPQCAKEALLKTEQIFSNRSAPSNKQLDFVMDIMSEYVFCDNDRRGNRRSNGLSPLQVLQLIDIICEYLSSLTNEMVKNTIFLSLFSGPDSLRRAKILSTLASMAVSASNISILTVVGVWLQQMGCSSPQSLQLVENIIRDHFFLNTSNTTVLKSLATAAPQFTANFMTSVTELYMKETKSGRKMPPQNLLEVITEWVFSNPTLCMSAQLNPAILPPGAIPMAVVTPLAGLMHWCSLAPLYVDEDAVIKDEPQPKKVKIEDETDYCKSKTSKTLSEQQLYIKLHLGVLQSLRAGKKSQGPPTAVNSQHICSLLTNVHSYAQMLSASGFNLQTDVRLQECLDRIGQAVQVGLSNGCIYGNINILLANLSTLPNNRLIRIVVKANQQNML